MGGVVEGSSGVRDKHVVDNLEPLLEQQNQAHELVLQKGVDKKGDDAHGEAKIISDFHFVQEHYAVQPLE